jgi:two-component system sensor histidine kinase BaeS
MQMTTTSLQRSMVPLSLGLLAALGLALLLAVGWLGAPRQDVMDLLVYLLFSGLASLGVSAAAVIWLRRGQGRLWQQITTAFSAGIAIAIFNVLLTARLMFISADHDLLLLTLLLLFAAVVSLTLGYTLARTLAQRVIALGDGARAIRNGNLAARVPAVGSDELAALALEFNHMADRLAASDAERRRLEASRRELIAAISHDLRTPLASVRAMVEALSDGLVEDPATVQRYLATMRGQIGHLSGLIDDLFELSQIDAGALHLDLQQIAPGELAGDVVQAMAPQAEARGVALACEVATGLPHIRCAPQKVERVLYNLISNALRHTPTGGKIVLRVYAEPRSRGTTEPQNHRTESAESRATKLQNKRTSEQASRRANHIQHSAIADPSSIVPQPSSEQPPAITFEVIDTGEGIAASDLPYIFDRFYRGEKSRSRATGGAGLGLAIARGIVEAHRGQIWLTSELGQGTRVGFSLPLEAER